MAPALRDLKRFLELDPQLPSDDLGLYNYRHQRKTGHVRTRRAAAAWPRHRCCSCCAADARMPAPPWPPLQKDGWPMTRSQYEQLLEKARRNAEE